jgi:hypothetical protein
VPKGKTNQPLKIHTAEAWRFHPAVVELERAGHSITSETLPADVDWIMHPAAGWHEAFFAQNDKGDYPFIEARLKAERARKRAK